jgi:beta-lactamase class A
MTSRPSRALHVFRWAATLLLATLFVTAGAEGGALLRTWRDAQAAYSRQDYALAVWKYDHTGFLLNTRPQLRQARDEAVTRSAPEAFLQDGAAYSGIEEVLADRSDSPSERVAIEARAVPAFRVQDLQAAAYRNLVQSLESQRASVPGTVSIYFRDLQDGTTIDLDGGRLYTAASVYKLAILAYLYHQESLGQVSGGDAVSYEPDDHEDGYYDDYSPGQTFTVDQLAERMIEESDNTSARMLARTLSWDGVEAYAHALGATNALIAHDNEMTPEDAATLLDAIYRGRAAGGPQTQAMLGLLENTVYRDGWIPGALPQVPVAHKVGFYGSAVNDAALVLAPDHPFILVIFTDSTNGASPAVFQQVATQVYAYVTTLPGP